MKLPIWEPTEARKRATNITKFIGEVNKRYATRLTSYKELHD